MDKVKNNDSVYIEFKKDAVGKIKTRKGCK